MEKIIKILSKNIWLLIILLSIPATWALFVSGFYGASDDMHIAWLYEFHKTLMLGQIPPRFVPDLSFGFGYPLFNFVFPLPFYAGEIFHFLGLSLVDSIKAVFFISIPLSGIFMYLLLRQFISKSLSLVGAVLYIYTPYRSVDLYIRGAIGEIVSFIFLPLIILAIIKTDQESSTKWIGIGGIALAFLILSHNITAYMFLPFAGLLMLLQFVFNAHKWKYLIKTAVMVTLGLFASVYFWLPALIESKLMKYDTVFNFADHFPTLKQLFTPYWGYGASVPGPGDGMSFFLGIANILLLVIGTIVFILSWKKKNLKKMIFIGWVLSMIITSFVLMNHRSSYIWQNLPLLPYFQFPWRFLILTTLSIPLLLAALETIKLNRVLIILVLGLIILPVISYFRPQDFLGRTDSYFINRYIPYPSASEEYLTISEEYLRLPNNTLKRPDRNYPIVTAESGKINSINQINDLHYEIKVISSNPIKLNFNKYFFPGWIAEVDGQRLPIQIGIPFGQISLNIPPGIHNIKIVFEETAFRKSLNAISLVSFLVLLGLAKNLCFCLKKDGHLF